MENLEVGQSWLSIKLTRGPIRGNDRNIIGLILVVKGAKQLEEFVKDFHKGNIIDLAEFDETSWVQQSTTEPSGKLMLYHEPGSNMENSELYTLNSIGKPLLTFNKEVADQRQIRLGLQVPNKAELVNLSFLRLVGLSSEEGIRIGITGAYSQEYVLKLKEKLMVAAEQFLKAYLVPIHISLELVQRPTYYA